MPTYIPAKKNTEFIFYISLVSQANTKLFQVNPTLAAGDVKVSIDGGAENNIVALPVVTPAGSSRVKVILSAAEMNGDNIQVTFSDALGDEWCDIMFPIPTSATQIDDLTRSTTPANAMNIDGDGNVTVGNLVSGSSAINTVAESFTLTTGSIASGSYSDTTSINSTYHQIQDDTGTIDCYYQFDVGANGSPVSATLTGRLTSANDSLNVYGYNWGTTSWELLGPLAGQDGSTDVETTFTFFTQHVGTGANLGKVRLRFQGTGLTSANLYVDQIYVSYAVTSISSGYGGFVWLDTVNGTSGTVDDYNGTSDRPVNNLADAITIAGSKNLTRIKVANGTSITFVQAMDNFSLLGELWTLALNGQSCSDTVIVGATLSGTCTGANKPCFRDCKIGTVTLPPCYLHASGFQTTITVGSAGDFYFENCYSMVAGGGTPIIDFGAAIGNTNLSMRKYSGGIEFQNINQSGTDAISLEGFGQYILNANCSGGNLSVRGTFKATDNASGAVTVDQEAEINKTQIASAVWNAATRTLTGFGTLIADIWSAATRTLTAGTKDSEIDAIKTVTDNLPDSGALTTIGADTARLTAARAATLTDWINGGRLDLLLDALLANVRETSFQKNTSLSNFTFTMRDSAGAPKTGETVSAQRILDAGSAEAMANSVTEVGSTGVYRINVDAADVNCDFGSFIFSSSGAVTRTLHFKTMES